MKHADNNPDSNITTTSAVSVSISLSNTVLFFVLGGLVTALFSASLAVFAKQASFIEVLAVGMVVPSFTWVVHLVSSAVLLRWSLRQIYWHDLSRVCFIGSVALLPAALVNLLSYLSICPAMLWLSALNVLLSVLLMAAELFRRCVRHQIATAWPIGWCCTIGLNMAIFVWVSRNWWK